MCSHVSGYVFIFCKKNVLPIHLFYLGNSNKLPISSAVLFSFYLEHKRQSIEGSLAKSRDRLNLFFINTTKLPQISKDLATENDELATVMNFISSD